jgi:NADH-quinone oxidoreductase subunit J
MENWQASNLTFWLITAIVLVSGGFAAFSRNIVQAAFSLFFTLLGMAGYWVLLGSGFLAVTQVIIYVGGILVLMMFGILLTNQPFDQSQAGQKGRTVAALIVAALLLASVLAPIVLGSGWVRGAVLTQPEEPVRPLGLALLGQYLLPLELAGMTLLLCLVGAAYLVRREER